MFILPFLCPLWHAYLAYVATSESFTVRKEGKAEKITVENLKKESYRFTSPVSERLQSFLDEHEIRKDLIILHGDLELDIGINGTNFFTRGIAAIQFPSFFHSTDEEALYFSLKHEISHLKNNDCFTLHLVPAICSLASAIICTRRISPIPAFLVTLAVGTLASILFTLYRENKADDFAIAHSSNDELKGGRRGLLSARQVCLDRRTSLLDCLIYSSKSERRLDIWHPSDESRLRKLKKALEERGISVNELNQNEQENNRIRKLKKAYEEQIAKINAYFFAKKDDYTIL